MEISYEVTFEDERNTLFDLIYNKKSLLYLGLIPVTCILIFEGIMITLGVLIQFTFIMTATMIIIPSLYLLVIILLPIVSIFTVKSNWRKRSKMPLQVNIIINEDGILVDEIFAKNKYLWKEITRVTNKLRHHIIINFGGIFIHTIPKRVLKEEEYQQLLAFFETKLDNDKLKIS